MVDDASLLVNDFIILVVYMVLRLETPRMFYMNTQLFDIGLIGLEVSNLAQLVIKSDSQSYEGNYVLTEDHPLLVSSKECHMCSRLGKSLDRVVRIERE